MTLWDTFKDFKRSTQVVLALSLLLGLALLVGFSLTDAGVNVTLGSFDPKPHWLRRYNADWFHTHAYIPNILAGFTGFLIGAPVATVVLATFTIQREEKAARDRVNIISASEWKRFRDGTLDFCRDERISALNHDATSVYQQYGETIEIIATFRTKAHEVVESETINHPIYGEAERRYIRLESQQDDYDEFFEEMCSQVIPVQDAFDDVTNRVGRAAELQLLWSAILTHWNTLDSYVRIDRLRWNLEWIDEDVYADLKNRMSNQRNPVAEFAEKHGSPEPYKTHTSRGISVALQELYDIPMCDKEEHDDIYLNGATSVFSSKDIDSYHNSAMRTAEFLRELRESVEAVDAMNWPACATDPVRTS